MDALGERRVGHRLRDAGVRALPRRPLHPRTQPAGAAGRRRGAPPDRERAPAGVRPHRRGRRRARLARRCSRSRRPPATTCSPGSAANSAIDAWVIDPTIRENLHVVEARGVTNKLAYIRAQYRRRGQGDRLLQLAHRGDESRREAAHQPRRHRGVLPCRRRLGRTAAGRAVFSRRRDPRDRRDLGVRRGHRSARRARRVSLPPELRSDRVQPAVRARRARRRRARRSTCCSASAIATSTTSSSNATRRRCTRCATSIAA